MGTGDGRKTAKQNKHPEKEKRKKSKSYLQISLVAKERRGEPKNETGELDAAGINQRAPAKELLILFRICMPMVGLLTTHPPTHPLT